MYVNMQYVGARNTGDIFLYHLQKTFCFTLQENDVITVLFRSLEVSQHHVFNVHVVNCFH